VGLFSRFAARLRQDEGERRSATIREWSETQQGCTLVGRAEPRSIVRVAGVVEALRLRPRQSVPQIEAQISDGTGSVTAVWVGRRSIPGLALGVRMIIEGRLAQSADGLQIMNPRFEFGRRQGELA
jgi:hypothetical protein